MHCKCNGKDFLDEIGTRWYGGDGNMFQGVINVNCHGLYRNSQF